MKIYMSLWTKPSDDIFIDMWKLSLALARKHYDYVELITDSRGFKMLKNLPFKDFHIILDDIPNYPNVWSLGKIYSYKYACSQSNSFLHIDSDVFLWDPLSSDILNSNLFCQSEDFNIGQLFYDLTALSVLIGINLIDMPELWIKHVSLKTYNMGIFGGNSKLISSYCDMVINMINDPLYLKLWKSNKQRNQYNDYATYLSCLVEQANFSIYCKQNNIVPSMIFKYLTAPDKSIKYTHLMSQKNTQKNKEKISSRVSSVPYNLNPKYL